MSTPRSTTAPTARTPTTPYGPLVETRVRVVTWNLWWRLGDWKARAQPIARTLRDLEPDLVCLQEVWREGDRNQAAGLAEQLGMRHAFAADRTEDGIDQGVAVLSRWPLAEVEGRVLPVPEGVPQRTVALRAVVEGPRGVILLATTHLVPFPPRSGDREHQVRALVEFLAESERRPAVTVVCGDFNAAPGSDEIRLLTGLRPPAVAGWTFLDAWETAGDGSPGYTMAKANPNSAPLLLPNLRWDYIFVRWPSGPGGIGHPVHAEVAGTVATDGVVPSDHYAVCAELRY
jgi:endonuclease/exonuclease/phosphatase family metal-dependent hydrolase